MSEYTEIEEKINIYSHLLGAVAGVSGLCLLIIKSFGNYDLKSKFSFIVFGLSIVILYFASANYHRTRDPILRYKRKIMDHCAIYILIAGTYTPVALSLIGDRQGWMIFILSWTCAFIGIILKLFFTGQFKTLSTIMYVLMGWMMIFFINPVIKTIPPKGFSWLLAGGILYTAGAIIYMIKKMKFNHAIFHVFILAASFSHFIAIYLYL